MCLAIPAKIVKIEDAMAVLEIGGVRKEASLDLIEDAEVDDYVLLHAGFAIQKLSQAEAEETLGLLGEIGYEIS